MNLPQDKRVASESKKGFLFFLKKGKDPKPPREERVEEGSASPFYRPSSQPGTVQTAFPIREAWGGVKGVAKAAALIAMIGLAWWGKNEVLGRLQEASGFKLAKVTLQGCRFLRAEDVMKTAGLPMGENMFKLDLVEAAARLEKMDWVEKVYLERRLPQTVLISVKERKPAALLDSGALYGVTEEGRVLSASEELSQVDLPLLSGVRVTPEAIGTTGLAAALKPGLDFLAFLSKREDGLAQEVSEVNLSDPQALKVTFIDGVTATFDTQVTGVELRRLDLVRSDLSHKGLRAGSMDFRYEGTVLVKLAGKGA